MWIAVLLLLGLPTRVADAQRLTTLVAFAVASKADMITIATVPVGNAGNVGELSGPGAGGYGTDRICGAVSYNYDIAKYETTAGQYTAFLNAVGSTDTYGLYNTRMWSDTSGCKIQRANSSGSYTYSVAAGYANRPVNFVSFGDAMRFTNWLQNGQPTGEQNSTTTESGTYTLSGGTTNTALMAVAVPDATQRATWAATGSAHWLLTSEDEFYKAAYYKGGGTNAGYWDYPTSSNTAPGRDLADALGNNANYYTGYDPYPIDSDKFTTLAGEFQSSASPYGTFDQGGNVWEWNDAIISGSGVGLRGGSFDSAKRTLASSYRKDIDPQNELNYVGFRVASVPEPSTFVLFGVGAVIVLGWTGRQQSRKAKATRSRRGK